MELVSLKTISLKDRSDIDERWIQDRIADDPSILGLGDLRVYARERVLPGSGRVDFVLEDPETDRRYVVEIQLGATDPSHIVRTLEYWDIERRRHPRYEHVAVLIAEDITGRFFNVISLLNQSIPIIAIKITAIHIDQYQIGLAFTRVLDLTSPATPEETATSEPSDRSWWEKRIPRESLEVVDRFVEILRELDPSYEPNYTPSTFIGMKRDGSSDNIINFFPYRKLNGALMEIRLDRNDDLTVSYLKKA